jgi:hypothetical protein
MFAHRGYQIDDACPITRHSEQPVKDGMRNVELVVERLMPLVILMKNSIGLPTYPLVELASYCLARHETTLADKQPALRIESGDSEHYLLCAIFEHPCLSLFQKTKQEAYKAGEETLHVTLVRL